MNEPRLRCARCGRRFLESENHDAACSYHTGRLMDYDRVFQLGAALPGDFWDCCSTQLQSEDDIGPGCAVGRHVEAAADDPGPIRRDFEEHERKMAQIIQEYHQDLHDSAPQEVKRARRLVQQFLAGDMDDLAALSLADLRILEGVSLAWLIARVGDTQYPLDRRRRVADLAQDPDTRAELQAGVDAEAMQETNELERKRPIMDATPRWFTYDDVDGPKAVRLSPGEWIVGRGADCAIVVRDFGCSRRHAKLMVEVDGVRIVDLKSKGGTQVNKTPVTEARLKSGDEVRLGTVLFRFVVGPAPAAQAPKQRPGLAKLTAALERPAGTLREETRLGELGSSFAALLYAVHRVAEAFKVELPREPLLLINTVGELLDLIEQAGGRISEEG